MDIQLREKTNFSNDVDEFGKIGEIDLIEHLNKSPKTIDVVDVSVIKEFQDNDVDVVQLKNGSINLQYVIDDMKSRNRFWNENYNSFEVKTDTFGIKSRNIVYEMLSNGNEGCLIRSKATYLYYIFIDADKNIKERFLMNLKELNLWLMTEFGNINNSPYLKSKYMDRGEDKTGILLINVDYLVNRGIAKKL